MRDGKDFIEMNGRELIPEWGDQDVEALRRRLADLECDIAALRESERKYRQIADHSGDCLWIMDLATLHFTYVSPSVTNIYGSTPEETMAQGIHEVMPPHSLEIVTKLLEEELSADAAGTADPKRTRIVEIQEYRKDGSLVWIENLLSFMRDEQQRPVAIMGVSRDVSKRRLMMEELRTLAITDPLTGAFNRRHFTEELQREMNRSDRYNVPFSLIMLDIDHFKNVNDRYGHETGDRALKGLVELIRKRIRASDLLVRWGGEEFMILLINMALPQAITEAGNFLERLRTCPFPEIGLMTASFGVTQYRFHESLDELLSRVDDLMYRAKREGRACIVHDPVPVEEPVLF
jgi:diguanylate cyclase (GGDEF)-like protein/PAS domain S-box-containing protein